MEIYIREQVYSFNQKHDFLVNPSPKTVYEIDAEDIGIEEFFILFFSCLNQFPLFITFEWYDWDVDGMRDQLDKLGVIYTHKFVPQKTAYTMTKYGEIHFDILIFSVEVKDKNQLSEIIFKSLIPYHLFIISNQNNVTFGERFDQEDSVKLKMNESTTFCKLEYDIPSTYLVTSQLKNMDELIAVLPEKLKGVKED
ncbi:hypothetical protein P4597_19280 [Peribacillus simplex]|uniref:hypothetical protein n=1 Tax=Peribacillus simplex TaxID=1478 RepID=UPI002E1B1D44|nr:hypothetical protein [Peribacillus simplex]